MPSKLRLPDGTFLQATDIADFTPFEVVTAQVTSATIPTTAGAVNSYITAPADGTLIAAQVTPLTALAANDTNYVTFTVTNLGQAGTGTTVMLDAVDANTTKATGGLALAVNTRHDFVLTSTGGDLVVSAGDRLRITSTATVGSALANTVTVPTYMLSFDISTT